jgi:hypothetical protein
MINRLVIHRIISSAVTLVSSVTKIIGSWIFFSSLKASLKQAIKNLGYWDLLWKSKAVKNMVS